MKVWLKVFMIMLKIENGIGNVRRKIEMNVMKRIRVRRKIVEGNEEVEKLKLKVDEEEMEMNFMVEIEGIVNGLMMEENKIEKIVNMLMNMEMLKLKVEL